MDFIKDPKINTTFQHVWLKILLTCLLFCISGATVLVSAVYDFTLSSISPVQPLLLYTCHNSSSAFSYVLPSMSLAF